MMKLVDKLKTCGLVNCLNRGLSISQIKWIALIAMTIDHLAAYGFEIPVFAAHFNTLRVIGRIAAPLFFFAPIPFPTVIAEMGFYTVYGK